MGCIICCIFYSRGTLQKFPLEKTIPHLLVFRMGLGLVFDIIIFFTLLIPHHTKYQAIVFDFMYGGLCL